MRKYAECWANTHTHTCKDYLQMTCNIFSECISNASQRRRRRRPVKHRSPNTFDSRTAATQHTISSSYVRSSFNIALSIHSHIHARTLLNHRIKYNTQSNSLSTTTKVIYYQRKNSIYILLIWLETEKLTTEYTHYNYAEAFTFLPSLHIHTHTHIHMRARRRVQSAAHESQIDMNLYTHKSTHTHAKTLLRSLI